MLLGAGELNYCFSLVGCQKERRISLDMTTGRSSYLGQLNGVSTQLILFYLTMGTQVTLQRVDMKAPIRQQLADVIILEFPVIYVFLPYHDINFQVIKDVNPNIHKPLQKDSGASHIPKGISFKEEIEDDNNPQILRFLISWSIWIQVYHIKRLAKTRVQSKKH